MLPRVSIVFLVYNRREKLRVSLTKMLEVDYPADLLDVVVVDNASTDGTADMVAQEFPGVRLLSRETNVGISGWNDGFDAAEGDFLLVLDDDCYLPGAGLREAVTAAAARGADMVSFSVTDDVSGHRFNDDYNTGLLSFWGCAVLMRREILGPLRGYDPEIFVWANELEFTMRFFDHGFRHLHLPEVTAIHMKVPTPQHEWMRYGYRINSRHYAYIVAKLLHPRDAAYVLAAIVANTLRDGRRLDRAAWGALPHIVRGLARGLRRRSPLASAEVSALYRRHMHSFSTPWSFRIARLTRRADGAWSASDERWRADFCARRRRFYPEHAATLEVR